MRDAEDAEVVAALRRAARQLRLASEIAWTPVEAARQRAAADEALRLARRIVEYHCGRIDF